MFVKPLRLMFVLVALELTGCSMDATIDALKSLQGIVSQNSSNRIALAPSQQRQAQDSSGQYTMESTIGEVYTSENAQSADGAYSAEVSVRYQSM